MAKSKEYPDLPWVEPRSWTQAGRTAVQLVVIHTTEGSAHSRSAEDGAAYDARRTDGTSTHYFHDSDSTVQCVNTRDRAHTARSQGNRRGIQHELCTRAGSANWADSYHQAMLRRAAAQCARDAKRWGIPVRKLSPAQVADGVRGFCGHIDITNAFPADGGTHTDPGSRFPWPAFLDMVRAELEDDDMPFTKDELAGIVRDELKAWGKIDPLATILARTGEQRDRMGQALTQLTDISGKGLADTPAIVAGVLAGLSPATIAGAVVDALPAEQAKRVADELAARLAA